MRTQVEGLRRMIAGEAGFSNARRLQRGRLDVVQKLVFDTNNIFDLRHKIERLSIKTRGCCLFVILLNLNFASQYVFNR